MGKRIVWHPEAKEDLRKILVYCRDEFGRETAMKVRDRLLSAVTNLSDNPMLGFKEQSLANITSLTYRSIIVRQTKVVYTIHEDYIYIHLLWNTWRNPSNLSLLTKKRD